jgi:NADPH-dependent curcumin reductase CurA
VSVGDHVTFVGGAFSEYVLAGAGALTKVPEATPEAVALRISGLTAAAAVEATGGAKRGETVLVTAGAGAAGSFAVQLAKRAGCRVVATCSSAEKAVALCKLGADEIVNYRTRDLSEYLARKHPRGIDLVVEHVGGRMLATALQHLAPAGRSRPCTKTRTCAAARARRFARAVTGAPRGRLVMVGYISEYPHNPARAEEAAAAGAAGVDSADLFWNGKNVMRGHQVRPSDPFVPPAKPKRYRSPSGANSLSPTPLPAAGHLRQARVLRGRA